MEAGQMDRHTMDGLPGTTSRMIDRYALAHDASHYLLVPELVSKPGSWDEVVAQLSAAAESGHAITFRSGGTSLSGQASAGDILMDTRSGFRSIEVLDDGRKVRVEPGAVLRTVNARLAPYGRKLGPDPASEVACTVGGVVANNSSGMHCGTSQNSYQTVASMVFILASGTMIDSAQQDADNRFRELEPVLYEGLGLIRDELRSHPNHVARIRRQFSMKNTMGYGINSFLDFERPVDILVHLLIGSEGTLAFIAQVTFNTVPLLRHAAAGLLIFDSLKDANTSLEALLAGQAKTLELLDAESLRVAQRQLCASTDPAVAALQSLEVRHHAALLVEAAEDSPEALAGSSASLNHVITGLPLNSGNFNGAAHLSSNAVSRTLLWKMRKGLYTSVAAARPPGTVALLEDIAVPLPALADTCESLTSLFSKYDYRNSVIFGHAKDGNIHFLLNEDFDGQGTRRYEDFTLDLVNLVLGADGTLKAEHGTGRVMAPFVRHQYGDELFAIMQRVKTLIDPRNVLNPGVLLNDDPQSYLKNIKPVPVVDDEINSCVECGYCEPACPSRNVTLTPRQRIVVRREIQGALDAGNAGLAGSLQADYGYEAVETCAADGMCSVACPVLIDTGKLMKRLRAETVGASGSKVASGLAGHWSAVAQVARLALTAAHAAPAAIPTAATKAGRKLLGEDRIPQWSGDVPRPGPARRGLRHHSSGSDAEFIYLPACINEIFGAADSGKRGVSNAFLALCERAGVKVHIPKNISSLCCGTPMSSKGFVAAADRMRSDVEGSILELCEQLFSDHQQILLVSDASSCSHSFKEIFMAKTGHYRGRIIVQDAVTFTRNHLLPLLPEAAKIDSLTLHPTCSTEHLGIMGDLTAVAAAVSNDVVVPADWGCCGFAGDRGMLHPELTASATRDESAEVVGHSTKEYASCNRTCEIGLSRATGQEYSHLLELLERQTR